MLGEDQKLALTDVEAVDPNEACYAVSIVDTDQAFSLINRV